MSNVMGCEITSHAAEQMSAIVKAESVLIDKPGTTSEDLSQVLHTIPPTAATPADAVHNQQCLVGSS